MQGLIAVEEALSRLADALETEGYETVTLRKDQLEGVDAIIVNGMDINLLNQQDIVIDVPVINASGKSIDEILAELETL